MAVIDIPNAFVQMVIKDEKDKFIMRMHGEVVDILCKLAPEVSVPFVMMDKHKCLIWLDSHQSFILQEVHLKFEEQEIRDDPSVLNKTVGGKQLTICFHVDDCKVSNKSPQVLNDTIQWLCEDYESIFEDGSGHMKFAHG